MNIIFCLPGSNYSNRFLKCYDGLIRHVYAKRWEYTLSQEYDPNIYFAMNKCVMAVPPDGKNQLPFRGRPYDVCFWIHSDIIFTTEDVDRIIESNEPIITGFFAEDDRVSCGEYDDVYFKSHGHEKLYTERELLSKQRNQNGLIEVGFAALGFTAIKRGVLETLEYPWFRPMLNLDLLGEDLSICLRLREKGFKILVNPAVRVGHEKRTIL